MTDTEPLKHIDDAEDSVARKLIKLVATARGNGATENEMEQAMLMAQRLAIKHRVDLATITEADTGMVKQEDIVEGGIRVGEGHRRPPADRFLTDILVDFFNVEVIYRRVYRTNEERQAGAYVLFIGRKSDVEFAGYAYLFMQKAFSRAWVKYKRETGAPMARRASFYHGVYIGLATKLRAEKGIAERQALADAGMSEQAYGLAVISEADARKAAVKDKHPVLVTQRLPEVNSYHHGAQSAGYKVGKELTINKAIAAKSNRPSPKPIEH